MQNAIGNVMHISATIPSQTSGGLVFITIRDENGMQQPLLEHKDFFKDTFLKYCRTHFAKSKGSPFTQAPLNHLLWYNGITPFASWFFKGAHYQCIITLMTKLKWYSRTCTTNYLPPTSLPIISTTTSWWMASRNGQSTPQHLLLDDISEFTRLLPSETRQRHLVPHVWHHVNCNQAHWPITTLENCMDDVHWKGDGKPWHQMPPLHCALWGGLATSLQMALLLWIPPNNRKSRNTHHHSSQRLERSQCNWPSYPTSVETELVHFHQKLMIDLYLDLQACIKKMVGACHNLVGCHHGANVA